MRPGERHAARLPWLAPRPGWCPHEGYGTKYTDNGDGTITDNMTGLTWEKLSRDGSIHDYSATYTWHTASTTKIAALNGGGGFAGHTDWRLPNINRVAEYRQLRNRAAGGGRGFQPGCVPGCTVTTCSCTQSYDYWSSTTYQGSDLRMVRDLLRRLRGRHARAGATTSVQSVAARDRSLDPLRL